MRLATCSFLICLLSTTLAEKVNFTGYLVDLYCSDLPNHTYTNVFANCIGQSGRGKKWQMLFYYLHAAVMVYAWAAAAPFAFIVVRYYKHHHDWLYWHQFFAQSTLIGASSALFTLVSSEKSFFEKLVNGHALFGVIILTLSCLQFFLGSFVVFAIKSNKGISHQKKTLYRRCKLLHRTLGVILLTCGLFQVITGSSYYPTLRVCLAFWYFLILGFVLYKEYHWQRSKSVEQSGIFKSLEDICELKFLPSYTQQEFRSKISTGSRWVIAGNAIVDIEEWIESHPGGAQLLRLHIGLDVTEQLIGGPRSGNVNDGPDRFHRHSNAALKLLHSRVQGRLIYGKSDIDTEQAGETQEHNIQFARLMHKECVCDVSAPIFKFVFAVKGVKEADLVGKHYLFVGTDDSYHIFERPYTPIQVLNFRPTGPLDSETEDVRMVEFYIRLYPNGTMSKFLASLDIGSSRLRISGPHLRVSNAKLMNVVKGNYDHVTFLTAGTGVVVFMQMLDMLMQNNVKCNLLWQVRNLKEIFEYPGFEKYLNQDGLEEANKKQYLRVEYVVTLTQRPETHLIRNDAKIKSLFDISAQSINVFRRRQKRISGKDRRGTFGTKEERIEASKSVLVPAEQHGVPDSSVHVAAKPYIVPTVHTRKSSSGLSSLPANRNILQGTKITAAIIKDRLNTILPNLGEPKMAHDGYGGKKKVCIVVSGPVQFSSYIYDLVKQDDVLNTVELIRLD